MKIFLLAAAMLVISTMAIAGHPTPTVDTIQVKNSGFNTVLVASYLWDYALNGTDTLTFTTAVSHWMVINRNTTSTDTVLVSDAQSGYVPKFTFRLMGGSSTVGESQFLQLSGEPGLFKRLVIKTFKSVNIQVTGY